MSLPTKLFSLFTLSAIAFTPFAYAQGKMEKPKNLCPPPKTHSHRQCDDNTPYTFQHCMQIYALYEENCFTSFPQDCKRLGEVFYGPHCRPYWTWVKGPDLHQYPYPRQYWIYHMEGI